MDLKDCAFPLVRGLKGTTDLKVGFEGKII